MKYLLCLLMLMSAKISLAQNLVPNPSFEDTACIAPYGCCPENLNELTLKNWIYTLRSPDYFNACANTSPCDVPANFAGHQTPATGSAYVGLISKIGNPNCHNYREAIGTKLLQPMIIGAKYYVSMKVSLADSANCGTNNIGMLFTTQPYNPNPLPCSIQTVVGYSQFFSDSVIVNKTGWTKISGIIIADSAYEYVSLGNFLENSALDTFIFANAPFSSIYQDFPNTCWSYYYVDDVCVSTDSLTCADFQLSTNNHPVQSKLSIYPTITCEAVKLTFPQGSTQFNIFNAIGQSVYNSATTALHETVDVSGFSEGIYFVRVHTGQGVQTTKFVVQR